MTKLLAVLLLLASTWAQPAADDQKAVAGRMQLADRIFRRHQIRLHSMLTGEKPSAKDEAWLDANAFLNMLSVDYPKTHPPKDSIGVKALTDFGGATYKSVETGLYPGGQNNPPPAHLNAGLAIAKSIAPLNTSGRQDPHGKIVLASIGYSNWTHEFSMFASDAITDPQRNPQVFVIDCALNGQSSEVYAHADAEYYKVVDARLRYAGLTPEQVQVIMIKIATQVPSLPFPWEPKYLQDLLIKSTHVLKNRFPNLRIMYLTSRIYGGYVLNALNPEPHAFETAFAAKWLIADQINGKPELNYDPAKGPVRAPWLAWGPYLWADGIQARSDGLQWLVTDFREDDRTHPSYQGRQKVTQIIDRFLKTDPTARIWYTR